MRRLGTIALLFAVTAMLGIAVGCNDHNCRAACARVYGEADDQCGAVHPSISEADEAIAQCTADCQSALYDERRRNGPDPTSFADEQSAVEFINCVWSQVDPTAANCAQVARTACQAAVR